MNEQSKTYRKLGTGIFTVIVLSVCLVVTTLAIVYATVTVDDNFFQTGIVKLNLNDGKPVIEENEYLFEPGMTVEKPFFVENQSTCDVYYRIYLDNVTDKLAEVLDVTMLEGNTILYSGKLSDMTRENVTAADDTLAIGERRDLTIRFHFPEDELNEAQTLSMSFDIIAEAVQTKNNPNRLFD